MSYSARITSQSPGCFLLLLDMSPSMRKPIQDATSRTPHEECISALNMFLELVVAMCEDGDQVKPYYAVSVLGYTFDRESTLTVSTLLPHVGPSIFQAVSDLQIAMQWRDDRGQLVTDDLTSAAHASWIDSASTKTGPVPKESVVESVRNWQQVHPHGFPPVIVHMTDGSQFPSQLEGLLRELLDSKPIQSSEPLLFNCVVPHHKAVGTLMLPALDDPPFEDLTLVSIWQNSSTLPRPLARRLQGEEEVLQRFCCFCLAASRDAASQFLHHVFRLLPETGTIQSQARALSDLDSIRRTQRETQYKRVAETRARLQDARARRAYIVSVVALAISIVALLFTLLKFFVAGK